MPDPHDLYGLPLERFIDERNALARELRRQHQRDDAAQVGKLRKPSLAAWAVNQLVRTQRRQIAALFEAGDALRQAQSDLLAGRQDPAKLRNAVEAERTAVDRLTDKARGLLSAEGHELSQARLEQVAETLHAAALDDDARDQVQDGCLTGELRHIGLGSVGAVARPASPKPGASGPSAAARRTAAEARRGAARATREVKLAEQRREQAARELQEAEAAVATAREIAERAERERRRAEQALEGS